jgi:hypothetical protein
MIPCYYEILRPSRISIFALEKPEHPFSRVLCELAKKLERL